MVEQLRTTLGAIARVNQVVESKASGHEDYDLFASFPGAGPVLAPRLLAALGEQRARFETATDLQKYASMAPVTERSGHSNGVHGRWGCPTFIRQPFVEWAALTTPHSFWATGLYQHQRSEGEVPSICAARSCVQVATYHAPVPEDEDDLQRSDLLSRHERPRLAASSQTRRIGLKWVDGPAQGVCWARALTTPTNVATRCIPTALKLGYRMPILLPHQLVYKSLTLL